MDQKANGVEPEVLSILPQARTSNPQSHCRQGFPLPYGYGRPEEECPMRFMVALAIVSSLVLPLAVPAEAQTRLPRTSPAERNTNEINRRIRQDQEILGVEQDIRSESNRIRQNIERDRLFAPRSLPPVPRAGCRRGSVC
jgi:hypothetical protein